MSICKSCAVVLTALNMSDIEEDWCNACVEIAIEKMHPEVGDPEVRYLTDEDLNRLSTMTKPNVQRMTRYLSLQNKSNRR